MARGLYRDWGGHRFQHLVVVDYDNHLMLVAEQTYRDIGYLPHFAKLPWLNKDGDEVSLTLAEPLTRIIARP